MAFALGEVILEREAHVLDNGAVGFGPGEDVCGDKRAMGFATRHDVLGNAGGGLLAILSLRRGYGALAGRTGVAEEVLYERTQHRVDDHGFIVGRALLAARHGLEGLQLTGEADEIVRPGRGCFVSTNAQIAERPSGNGRRIGRCVAHQLEHHVVPAA
jgi:hypothetical protein